jgi:hypothetical protein
MVRAIVFIILIIAVASERSYAIEVLTTSAGQVAIKEQIKKIDYDRKLRKELLKNTKKELDKLANDEQFIAVINKVNKDKDANLFSIQLDETKISQLSSEEKNSVINYQSKLALYFLQTESLREFEKQTPNLKSLTLAPSFQINTGTVSASYVPAIDGIGSFEIGKGFDFQFLFSIKPDPPSGNSNDVAQSIRINTGVFTGNIGVNYNNFWKPESDTDGPQGFEGRLGIPISYQRASSSDNSSTPQNTTGASATDFGIFSPEIKLSLWLKYVLVGCKYSYHKAFGTSNQVSKNLDNSNVGKIYLASRIDALGGNNSPFYVETSYTSNKDKFNNGTFSIGFSKGITWTTN